jgi:F-type H+-transporting ATPase subunit epsilon
VAEPFMLRLLTPDKSIYEDKVEALIVPGSKGELGVLAGHTKFITDLVPGCLRYVRAGQTERMAISGGFAEVYSGGATVLADSLERPGEIDVERAKRSKQEVAQALANRAELGPAEFRRLEARLARAENRLKLAGQQ